MKKIVIITGLTGSGKSSLAVKIAKKFNGEIISADSVQIYKQLNIGSAKITDEQTEGIKHHLINIKNFDQTYNVGEFINDCKTCIDQILSAGKLPIICGGTGLYIKALLEGYTLGNSANLEFRQKYQKLAQQKGNKYVWDCLNEVSPTMASGVHPNNLKRVIRYLELCLNNIHLEKTISPLANFKVCCVGIVEEKEQIYPKLNNRVDAMLESGLEEEVKTLIDAGATVDMQAFNSIGYKEWFEYFNGAQTKEQTISLIKQHNRNYCKRQLTFLKTINDVKLLKIQEAEQEIERFLND